MIKPYSRLSIALLAFICGCTTVPTPKYYRIPLDTPPASDASLRPCRESLRIARFHAVAPLRQDSVVTYQEGSPLVSFSPSECWESSPPDMVTRKLTQAFWAVRLFSRVDSRPSTPPATYLIRGKILRFNRLQTAHGLYGEVELQVEFVDMRNREILWSARIQARKKARDRGREAAILAVGAALQQCIGQVVQRVEQASAYRRPSF
ncbi:MAG: membrane integrity-associated transporter subunit PqiC [Deltaproteobacteria bacterium]|nr:membrane integrity-associated transporter subunit PqiC [Deltaproteobacteria bacterium]